MSSAPDASPTRGEPQRLARSESSAEQVRVPSEHEWCSIVAWLDDALRDGCRGRLEQEYPVSLQHRRHDTHRVVGDRGGYLAHAMFHIAELRVPSPLRVGMIGLVYTDPAARGRGLARSCVDACVDALRERGVPLALLWSDKHAFYERLGFHPVGRERAWLVDPALCRAARHSLGSRVLAGALPVESPKPRDWRSLETLYAQKRSRAVRAAGALESLASAPDTQLVVARRGKRAVAYAAMGRGDDLQGVVHEWAGPPREVISCIEALSARNGALLVHAGPDAGALPNALEQSGAQCFEGPLALGRILSPGFELPSSLYLWGFDSI